MHLRACAVPPCSEDHLTSHSIASAGVVARLLDPSSDPDVPWLPCSKAGSWCVDFGDRLAASLVHPYATHLYEKEQGGLPGFIVAPGAATLRCGYPSDGSSMDKTCATTADVLDADCIPGCPRRGAWDWVSARAFRRHRSAPAFATTRSIVARAAWLLASGIVAPRLVSALA